MANQGTGFSMQPAPGSFGPIEVFRVGTFSDMAGTPQTIKRETLASIAATYDPEANPAPVVIGHPETDAPAFGWVDRPFVENDVLKANLRDVVPEFADAVKAGRYKRVSISLFTPGSTANPTPGDFHLRHVGFLGATAPAVPGLKPVKFAGGAGQSIALSQNFAAPLSPEARELAQLRREAVERKVEDLISQGRVLPAFKDEVLSFAAHLGSSDTVSFSDGSEKPAREWFLDYLAKQPSVVSFGEFDLGPDPFAHGGVPRAAGGVEVPAGYTIDPRGSDLAARATEVSRAKGISFADALDLVQGQVR
ncbi:hypothetical protein PUH89_06545 [Rhodobacter capsulatus]|nr:hypothetical protein [Rhodobacter capsulatus]WER10630.1 hypothetical protein PUH89_06545 [Rhodobacter capsulatus]